MLKNNIKLKKFIILDRKVELVTKYVLKEQIKNTYI